VITDSNADRYHVYVSSRIAAAAAAVVAAATVSDRHETNQINTGAVGQRYRQQT